MIPVGLITGFLGSGKTTLLQRIVDRHRDRRYAYVVNECGQVDIDGKLLELPPDRLVRLPGGSIFCRCLSGAFVDVLRALAAEGAEPPDAVIIEASGIADPKVMREMLREHRLEPTYDLRRIVSVVDPGSFLKLIRTLPNIVAQIEASDLAIVNKTDVYSDREIEQTEFEINQINSRTRILRATYCDVEIDLTATTEQAEVRGEYAPCADPRYATSTLPVSVPVDADRVLDALRSLRDDLYRAKGFLPSTEGVVYVDLSASGLAARRIAYPGEPGRPIRPGEPGHLVLIARPEAQERVGQLGRKMREGAFNL